MAASVTRASGIKGTNAGSLWQIGDAGNIYLSNDLGACSPFDNPNFQQAFNKARVIAISNFYTKEELQSIQASRSDSFFSVVGSKTVTHMTDEMICKYNEKLISLIEKLPPHPNLKEFKKLLSDEPRELFAKYFFVYLTEMLTPKELKSEIIKEKAMGDSKTIVPIISIEETLTILEELFAAYMGFEYFDILLDEVFLSEKKMRKVLNYVSTIGKKWDLGAVSESHYKPTIFSGKLYKRLSDAVLKRSSFAHQEESEEVLETPAETSGPSCSSSSSQTNDFSSDPAGRLQKLENEIAVLKSDRKKLKRRITTCKEIEEKLTKQIDKFSSVVQRYHEVIIQRAVELFETEPQTLAILNIFDDKHFYTELNKKNVRVVGPIRQHMKPIGFLWELRKTQKVTGYLLGSIHITPERILQNFNSSILNAFSHADVLGVEADITRPDVVEPLKDPSGEEIELSPERQQPVDGVLQSWGVGKKLGIDVHFIHEAKTRNMPIVDLESIETHQEAMPAVWRQQLKETPLEAFEHSVVRVFPELYEMGIAQLLDDFLLREDKESKALLNRRNMEMAMTMDKQMRKGSIPFGIAGALHFAGKYGIQKHLKRMGYEVSQVICEEEMDEVSTKSP